MIRKVDLNGIISTVLGSHDLTSARPLTCDTSMHIRQVPCNIIPKKMELLIIISRDLVSQVTRTGAPPFAARDL